MDHLHLEGAMMVILGMIRVIKEVKVIVAHQEASSLSNLEVLINQVEVMGVKESPIIVDE